jgi:hypothetical protein
MCGPSQLFRRLDRDRDGAIKAEDFDWSPQSAYLRLQADVRRRSSMMDTNSNGKISRSEWDEFFARAAKDKEELTQGLDDALYASQFNKYIQIAIRSGFAGWKEFPCPAISKNQRSLM